MAATTQTIAAGAVVFAATERLRDDQGDSKTGGTYTHNVLEWSATECSEWTSWKMYVTTQIQARRFYDYT